MKISTQNMKENKTVRGGDASSEKITMTSADSQELIVERGDIVYVSLPIDDFDHSLTNHGYAVVCSNNSNNLFSPVLEVVFLSKPQKTKNLPTHFWTMIGDKAYVAHCEQITSVSRDRIERIRGRLSEAERKMLNHCLMISLGM